MVESYNHSELIVGVLFELALLNFINWVQQSNVDSVVTTN